MEKKAVGRAVHITASVVMSVLALAAFILYAVMFFEFIEASLAQGNAADPSEQLGNGIGAVFALVFMIIFGGADLVLALVGLVLSITVIRFCVGREKIFGIVTTSLNGFFILASVASFAVAIVLNNTGAI